MNFQNQIIVEDIQELSLVIWMELYWLNAIYQS